MSTQIETSKIPQDTMPLVSVGIPTFNRPKGLKRTLECITRQSYSNIEIIVSDNCSPDIEVERIAQGFALKDPRIQYFRQKENKGPWNNFKFVLEKATGEFFMWAADDDMWEDNFIEICLMNIKKAGSAFTGFTVKNYLLKTKKKRIVPDLSEKYSTYKNACNYFSNIKASLFYGLHRKESLHDFLKDEPFDFYDCFFVLRQILTYGFHTIPDVDLYHAGINTEQYILKSNTPNRFKMFEYLPFFYKSSMTILNSRNLNCVEKVLLIRRNTIWILKWFICYEREYRPLQVSGMKLLKLLLMGGYEGGA